MKSDDGVASEFLFFGIFMAFCTSIPDIVFPLCDLSVLNCCERVRTCLMMLFMTFEKEKDISSNTVGKMQSSLLTLETGTPAI